MIDRHIAARFTDVRHARGWSIAEAAAAIGIEPHHYEAIEHADGPALPEWIAAFSRKTNTSIGFFFGNHACRGTELPLTDSVGQSVATQIEMLPEKDAVAIADIVSGLLRFRQEGA